MNIQQMKQIIADAPDGATHYVVLQYDMIEVYWKMENGCIYTLDEDCENWVYREDVYADGCYHIDELDLYRTIVEQHEEIERLCGRVGELESKNKLLRSNLNSKPCAMESVSQTMAKAQPPKENTNG